MELKKCDRCKKVIDEENEIGVTLEIANFTVKQGFVKPPKRLIEAAKEAGWQSEYLPLLFDKKYFGEVDLCSTCFTDFMKLKETATPTQMNKETLIEKEIAEFDEKFAPDLFNGEEQEVAMAAFVNETARLKEWLKVSLSRAYEAGKLAGIEIGNNTKAGFKRGRIEGYEAGQADTIALVREKLPEAKDEGHHETDFDSGHNVGWNQLLEEVSELLSALTPPTK